MAQFRNYTVTLLFLLFSTQLKSKEYRFEQLGVEDGLSDITVRSIYQDEVNRIWIATLDGLNCYDGNNIREFRQQTLDGKTINTHRVSSVTGNKNGLLFLITSSGVVELDLRTERMRMIFEKNASEVFYKNGHLWICSQHFVHQYDIQSEKISKTYKLPYEDIIITNLLEDTHQNLWISTRNYGLIQFSPAKKGVKLHYTNTHGRMLLEDDEGNIWYTTQSSGVYVFNSKSGKSRHYLHDPANPKTITEGFNRAITQDGEGNIWLGTNLGLSCIKKHAGEITRYKASSLPNTLPSSSINALYTDNKGTIWIGTYFGGLSYFNPSLQKYRYVNSGEQAKPTFPAIGSFCEDNFGNVWVGSEGGGLYCYDPLKLSFDNFNTSNSALSSNYIKKIAKAKNSNHLWIGTDNSGILNLLDPATRTFTPHFIELPDGQTPRAIFAIESHNSRLYLGTDIGVIEYNMKTKKSGYIYKQAGQFSANYNDLLIDSKKRLWFANNNTPISYSLENAELSYYSYGVFHTQLESNGISNIFFEDNNHQIWLGTNGYGILKLDEEKNSFSYSEQLQQLSNQIIMAIDQTKGGDMLISTTKSLFVVRTDKPQLLELNSQMGFPLKTLIKRGLYVSTKGDVYVGGVPTMVIYNENDLASSVHADEIQLSELYVNNTIISPGDKTGILNHALPYTSNITLKPSQNYLTIAYSTDNYFKTNDNKIEYRLKGYDQTWSISKLGHAISYTNLNPGHYQFEIRSTDNPALIKTLSIKVRAPFYASIPAYLVYLLLLAVIVYYLVREYHTRVKLKTSLAYQERETQQIEEMNQSKIRFFVNISHEIRTPITLVLAQTEVLLNSPNLHAKTRSKIMNIHRNLLNLKHLVTELMDFRKQEKGELVLKFAETDVVALLREHYHLFNGLGETRNIRFSFISPFEKLMVWMDSEQFIKVVNNLTINAFKFSKESGQITISLDENKDNVYISFEDTGIGIPEDELGSIFNRFYSAANATGMGGTGIGLALSKNIIEAHYGSITVNSIEGEGSQFTVRIPKGNAHIPGIQIEQPHKSLEQEYTALKEEDLAEIQPDIDITEEGEKPLVLVVEDNVELCTLIATTLSHIYTVETAYDGMEGWEKARELQPHLIITDVMMPRLSGVDLCVRVKKSVELCHIPVILLTARQSDEYEIEGLRIGADSYLTKPFEFKKLIFICNNLMNSRKLIQNKFRQNKTIDTEVSVTNEYDQEFMNRITGIIFQNLENEDFTVDMLASEIGVSRTKLFGKIKTIAGTTPNNLIQELRLNKAAEYLLNNPEMNVADISYQLCFNSPRYFNKCFKEKFGIAPMHYKKENKPDTEKNPTENSEIDNKST